MISKEVAGTEDWSEAETAILEHFRFDDLRVIKIFELVFHKQPFWEITLEFITELGDLYLWIISGKELRTFAGKL